MRQTKQKPTMTKWDATYNAVLGLITFVCMLTLVLGQIVPVARAFADGVNNKWTYSSQSVAYENSNQDIRAKCTVEKTGSPTSTASFSTDYNTSVVGSDLKVKLATHNVTFELNDTDGSGNATPHAISGISNVPYNNTLSSFASASLPDDPTRTGYTFKGWYVKDTSQPNNLGDEVGKKAATGSEKKLGDYKVASNVTLIAKWEANSYAVTLEATTGVSNLTFTYNSKTYSVNENSNPKTVTTPSSEKIPYWTELTVTATARAGYTITWATTNAGQDGAKTNSGSTYTFKVRTGANDSCKIKATGVAQSATLKFSAGVFETSGSGGGRDSLLTGMPQDVVGTTDSALAEAGQTLPSPSREGWNFEGWKKESDSSDVTTYPPTHGPGTTTYVAQWSVESAGLELMTGYGAALPNLRGISSVSIAFTRNSQNEPVPANKTLTEAERGQLWSTSEVPYDSGVSITVTLANGYKNVVWNYSGMDDTAQNVQKTNSGSSYTLSFKMPRNKTSISARSVAEDSFVKFSAGDGASDITLKNMPGGVAGVVGQSLTDFTFPTVKSGSTYTAADGFTLPTREEYDFAGWFLNTTEKTAYDSTLVKGGVTYTAHWIAKSTTNITFSLESGTAPTGSDIPSSAITGKAGSRVTAAFPKSVPTRANYKFAGWQDVSGNAVTGYPATFPASNMTIKATWTAASDTIGTGTQTTTNKNATFTAESSDMYVKLAPHSVNFYLNYNNTGENTGTTSTKWITVENVKYNNTISAPAAPTRQGYSFGGWFTDAACNTAANFTTMKIASTTNLFAKWNVETKTATINWSSANGIIGASGVTAEVGTVSGKTFTPDGSTTFTKNTDPANHTLTQSVQPGKYVRVTVEDNASFDWAKTVLEDWGGAPGENAWIADGTYGKGNVLIFKMPENPVTITISGAQLKNDKVVITYHLDGGKVGEDEEYSEEISKGGTATPPNATKTGYLVDKWYTNEDKTIEWDNADTFDDDADLYVTWKVNVQTITLKKNDGTTETAATIYQWNGIGYYASLDGNGVPTGSAITKTTAVLDRLSAGYVFGGYNADGDATKTEVVKADGTLPVSNTTFTTDTTLLAMWSPRTDLSYTVRYTDGSGNDIKAAETTNNQTFGDTIPVDYPEPGVTGWQKKADEPAQKSVTIAVNNNENVIEFIYEKITYNVTFVVTAGEGTLPAGITNPQPVKYDELAQDPGKATSADSTKKFAGWYNGENKWTFSTDKVTGNITLTAKFEARDSATYKVNVYLKDKGADTFTLSAADSFEDDSLFVDDTVSLADAGLQAIKGFTFDDTNANNTQGSITLADKNTVYELDAYYTRNSYTITLHSGSGATVPGGFTSYEYDATGAFALPAVGQITRTGYTFSGWYDNDAGTGTAVSSIAADETGAKTYYAKWTAVLNVVVPMSVTFNVSYDGDSLKVTNESGAEAAAAENFTSYTIKDVRVVQAKDALSTTTEREEVFDNKSSLVKLVLGSNANKLELGGTLGKNDGTDTLFTIGKATAAQISSMDGADTSVDFNLDLSAWKDSGATLTAHDDCPLALVQYKVAITDGVSMIDADNNDKTLSPISAWLNSSTNDATQ